MAYLALVRHGLSTYNQKGLWAGWDNPDLTSEGIEEAKKAGEALKNIQFDYGYTSVLQRAIDTLEIIKRGTNQTEIPTIQDKNLNERNYGDYTAKNKWDIKNQIGEEEFKKLRRSWDFPIPNGESLKQVYERVIPYFEREIFSKVKNGHNVILSSSNNALRSLLKYLEIISDADIANHEMGTGEVYLYTIDSNGTVIKKDILSSNPNTGKI